MVPRKTRRRKNEGPSFEVFDGALLSAHSYSSVCGSQAKSRTLYGEWCHLRFGLTVTSGTHKDCYYPTEMMMFASSVF